MQDEIEFKQLIHRHKDLIWSICKHFKLSAAWQTEDAFNEVLCAMWQDKLNNHFLLLNTNFLRVMKSIVYFCKIFLWE